MFQSSTFVIYIFSKVLYKLYKYLCDICTWHIVKNHSETMLQSDMEVFINSTHVLTKSVPFLATDYIYNIFLNKTVRSALSIYGET